MKQIINEINKIEKEAKKLGIPFFSICTESGINNSTVQRWRSGETQPMFSNWELFKETFALLKGRMEKSK